MVFTDGRTIVPMVSSQDHKRIFDGDKGPIPVAWCIQSCTGRDRGTRKSRHRKDHETDHPALRSEGIHYKGILYAGLMIDKGIPSVLEFNCRLGDPETQPVLSRLKTDLMDIAMAVTDERLSEINIEWNNDPAVCVYCHHQDIGHVQKR